MEQKTNTHDAVMRDAQVLLKMEEFASSMVQSTNDAAVKDAPIKSSKEECARCMGPEYNAKDAAVKDVQV